MTVLSIGMIVKNEEKRLRRTLEALQPLRDAIACQLIIADTGSGDDTIEIAQEFADTFLQIEWENDFAKARNATLAQAEGAWFFYLDADEVLTEPQELIDFLKSREQKKYQLISFDIRNCISEKENRWNTFSGERIFRRHPDEWFSGALHEECRKHDPVRNLQKTYLAHYGYNNDDKDLMEHKSRRNLAILERMIAEAGDTATGTKGAKLWLDYVDSLTLQGAHEEEGIAAAEKAIALLLPLPIDWVSRVAMLSRGYAQKLGLLAAQELAEECIACAEEFFEKQPIRGQWDIDICFYVGWAYWNVGEAKKAQEFLEQYFTYAQMEQPQDIARMVNFKSTAMYDQARLLLCEAYRTLREEDKLWQCVCAITQETVDGINVVGYQWQIALAYKSSERLPQLYAKLHDGNREMILSSLADAVCKKDDLRNKDIADGLRQLVSEYGELLPVLALATDDADELIDCLQEMGDSPFTIAQGSIIRQCLKLSIPLRYLMVHLREDAIADYLDVCQSYYSDWFHWAVSYFSQQETDDMTLTELWASWQILRYGLFNESTNLDLLSAIWQKALSIADTYLQAIYQPIALTVEQCFILPPVDAFALYAAWGENALAEKNYTQAMAAWRKALSCCPQAHAVIERKLVELEWLIDPQGAELRQLAEQVKAQIRGFIAQDDLSVARQLLDELSAIVPNDPDIPYLLEQAQPLDIIWN